MWESGPEFLRHSRSYLLEKYLPRIRRSVEAMDEQDLWWRPNPRSNSVGNLLLHLSGNVTQWVISGIGAAPDRRERDREFSADGGWTGPELLALLEATLREADAVLASVPPEELGTRRVIQGTELTTFEAIYHVVEHFATHVGQIIYIAKLRTGRDLQFYRFEDDKPLENW